MIAMTSNPDMLSEKPVGSQLLYDGKIVHLYLDTVELPNGRQAKREVIRHIGAVAIVPIDAAGQVILVRQFRHAAGRILLEIPAGTLNKDEDPDLAAMRELQEETGYKAEHLRRIGGLYTAPGYTSEYIHLYIATGLTESALDKDEDEFIEVERMPLQSALNLIRTGQIADGKSISGLLLAKDMMSV
jgi:ADP-ribose pyrophosphatase